MGDVIQLRSGLTKWQMQQLRVWARSTLDEATASDDRSLVQDIAGLAGKIEAAAILAGAVWAPRRQRKANPEQLDGLGRIFAQLYNSAEQAMFKAMDRYPNTQELPPRPRRRRRRRRSNV